MDLRDRLRIVLRRLELSARELELQPEAFQATAEIKLAAGDLAALIESLPMGRGSSSAECQDGLEVRDLAPDPAARNVSGGTQMQSSNRGTGLALARLRSLWAA